MAGIGSGVGSFDISCSGMNGTMSGDDRAVGAADPIGEGATAGIILGEAITVEPPLGNAKGLLAPGERMLCIWLATSVQDWFRESVPALSNNAETFWRAWGSLVLLMMLRVRRARCSSRMKPIKMLRKTHFPMFTVRMVHVQFKKEGDGEGPTSHFVIEPPVRTKASLVGVDLSFKASLGEMDSQDSCFGVYRGPLADDCLALDPLPHSLQRLSRAPLLPVS